jgi:hypothetical protein
MTGEDDSDSDKDGEARFEVALKGAMSAPDKPLRKKKAKKTKKKPGK